MYDKYWRIPITVGAASAVFLAYNLDIVSEVIKEYGGENGIEWGGKILTVLLIAGGSDGILHIFERFNIRTDRPIRETNSTNAFSIGTLSRMQNRLNSLTKK